MLKIDELKLYRGDDYVLPNGVIIRCPTLDEICDYGESEYLAMVSIFTSTAIDRCAQLDDMGIDYTQITNFEVFSIFAKCLTPQDTKPLFGELNFSELMPINGGDKLLLGNESGIVFDEDNFEIMASYIRKIHGIPPPLYTKVTNEFAKKQMVIDARNDAAFQKKLRAYRGERSTYQPCMSALVNHSGSKYNWKNIWDVKVYAFFDSLKRISIIENANHLYTGLYSGCVKYDKIKKDLDWLRPIEER